MRTRTTGPVTPPGTAAPVSSTSKPKPGKTPRATAKTPVAKEPAAAAYAKSKSKSTAGGSGSRTTSTVPTIPNDASTKKPKSSSYYRTIAGVRYDRKVLEDCEASVGDDGVIDLDEAKQIVEDVLDGAVKVQKRGVLSAVTDVELATLRYAHQHFTWAHDRPGDPSGHRGPCVEYIQAETRQDAEGDREDTGCEGTRRRRLREVEVEIDRWRIGVEDHLHGPHNTQRCLHEKTQILVVLPHHRGRAVRPEGA